APDPRRIINHQMRRPQKLAEIQPYHPPRNQEPFDRTQREFHSFRAYKPALHPRREQPRRHTQRKPWRQRQDVLLPGQPPPPPPYHYQQRRRQRRRHAFAQQGGNEKRKCDEIVRRETEEARSGPISLPTTGQGLPRPAIRLLIMPQIYQH